MPSWSFSLRSSSRQLLIEYFCASCTARFHDLSSSSESAVSTSSRFPRSRHACVSDRPGRFISPFLQSSRHQMPFGLNTESLASS